MFKPNPKKQVELKFVELFGRDYKVKVEGARAAGRTGRYSTHLIVNGETVASAMHADWRMAYKLLKLEVEKLFSEGVQLV